MELPSSSPAHYFIVNFGYHIPVELISSNSGSIILKIKYSHFKSSNLAPGDFFFIQNSQHEVQLALESSSILGDDHIKLVGLIVNKNDINITSSSFKSIKNKSAESEARNTYRIDARISGIINAEIEVKNKNFSARIYDFSSSGFCLIIKNINDLELEKKDSIIVNLKKGDKIVARLETFICWIVKDNDNLKLGARIISKNSIDDSKIKFINLDDQIAPRGVITKDFFYFENSGFKIKQLNRNFIKIHLQNTNVFIYEGQKIDLKMFLHIKSKNTIKAEVLYVKEVDISNLEVLLKVLEMPGNLENDLENYIIETTSISPEEIRSAGFNISHIANSFTFRYIQTHEEYLDVLKLRHLAYSRANKTKEDSTFEDMAAPLDYTSRVLSVYHGNKIIASASITFPNSNELILDTERALVDGYPSFFPEKIDLIEVSRLCTHPEYRRGDLLLRIFEHIYKINAETKRSMMVTSCDDKLWLIYKKIGFHKTGVSYSHPYLKGIIHHLIYIRLHDVNNISKIPFLNWITVYGKMHSYLRSNGVLEIKSNSLLKIKIADYLHRILNFFKA